MSELLQEAKANFDLDQLLYAWPTVGFTVSDQPPQEHHSPVPLPAGGRDTPLQNAQAPAHRGNIMPAQRSSLVAHQELDPSGGSLDFVNAYPYPLPSPEWALSQLADEAMGEKKSSPEDTFTEHPHSHCGGGTSVASLVETRKSHGSAPYDEDMGNTLCEAAQKAALASSSSSTSGAASPQSVMSNDVSLEGDGELAEEANFKKFSTAVLGHPRQYAAVPAFSRPTWGNGEPITLGIVSAAQARLLQEILTREGIDIRTHTAFIDDVLSKFLYREGNGSEPAFLELMSECNSAAKMNMSSALTASSHAQSQFQNLIDRPSDLDSSAQPEPVTARDSSSSREPTPVSKPAYSCPTCAKSFSRGSTLSRHAKSHRGVKDYKCAVCPRAFSRKDLLNRHMSLHDRVAKWVCGAHRCHGQLPDWGCGREFAREDDLKRHFGSQKGRLCTRSIFFSGFQSKHSLADFAYLCEVGNRHNHASTPSLEPQPTAEPRNTLFEKPGERIVSGPDVQLLHPTARNIVKGQLCPTWRLTKTTLDASRRDTLHASSRPRKDCEELPRDK